MVNHSKSSDGLSQTYKLSITEISPFSLGSYIQFATQKLGMNQHVGNTRKQVLSQNNQAAPLWAQIESQNENPFPRASCGARSISRIAQLWLVVVPPWFLASLIPLRNLRTWTSFIIWWPSILGSTQPIFRCNSNGSVAVIEQKKTFYHILSPIILFDHHLPQKRHTLPSLGGAPTPGCCKRRLRRSRSVPKTRPMKELHEEFEVLTSLKKTAYGGFLKWGYPQIIHFRSF